MNKPSGVGLYIWIIRRLYEWFGYVEADPEEVKARAVAQWLKGLGIKWIIIKLSQQTWYYNLRWDGNKWVDDRAKPFIEACIAEGIRVWGYGYVHGEYPRDEGLTMGNRVDGLRDSNGALLLSGWVIDAEGEMKERVDGTAEQQCFSFRQVIALPFPLALSSYRYPELHRELPWDEYLKRVQYNMPQVYWMGKHNPEEQLIEAFHQFEMLPWEDWGIVPTDFVPTGAAFNEHGWVATYADILEFSRAAQRLEFEAISYWEAWEMLENGFEDAISLACEEWNGSPPDPPPDGWEEWKPWVEGELKRHDYQIRELQNHMGMIEVKNGEQDGKLERLDKRVTALEAGGLIRMVVSNERKNKVRIFYPLNDHELAMHLDQTKSFATGQVFTVTNPKEWKTDDDVGKQLFWQVVCEGDYPCPKPHLVNDWVRDRDIKQV